MKPKIYSIVVTISSFSFNSKEGNIKIVPPAIRYFSILRVLSSKDFTPAYLRFSITYDLLKT